jgi:hypothetical protein
MQLGAWTATMMPAVIEPDGPRPVELSSEHDPSGLDGLTAYTARDWRATFFAVGTAHSIAGSTAWQPTPWRAVQAAAWDALREAVE